MSADSVIPMIKQIDQLSVLSVTSIRLALQCDLHDTQEDSSVLRIYQGTTEQWKQIELRLLKADGNSGAMLILQPANPVSVDVVAAQFGNQPPLLPPNPAAGANAVIGYEYVRPHGRLRVTFKSFQDYFVDSIVFDRMPESSPR